MNKLMISNDAKKLDHVDDEGPLLEELQAIWLPHQKRDLKVRYEMGVLLNSKLGQPTVRQSYGLGTINLVSKELHIDKSDISRMRRFAAMYESFEAFQKQEPEATCWSKVRALITEEKSSDHPTDSRAIWGLLRSVNSAIKALGCDHNFVGPKSDELCLAVQRLVQLAQTKLNFQFDDTTN